MRFGVKINENKSSGTGLPAASTYMTGPQSPEEIIQIMREYHAGEIGIDEANKKLRTFGKEVRNPAIEDGGDYELN